MCKNYDELRLNWLTIRLLATSIGHKRKWFLFSCTEQKLKKIVHVTREKSIHTKTCRPIICGREFGPLISFVKRHLQPGWRLRSSVFTSERDISMQYSWSTFHHSKFFLSTIHRIHKDGGRAEEIWGELSATWSRGVVGQQGKERSRNVFCSLREWCSWLFFGRKKSVSTQERWTALLA